MTTLDEVRSSLRITYCLNIYHIWGKKKKTRQLENSDQIIGRMGWWEEGRSRTRNYFGGFGGHICLRIKDLDFGNIT